MGSTDFRTVVEHFLLHLDSILHRAEHGGYSLSKFCMCFCGLSLDVMEAIIKSRAYTSTQFDVEEISAFGSQEGPPFAGFYTLDIPS